MMDRIVNTKRNVGWNWEGMSRAALGRRWDMNLGRPEAYHHRVDPRRRRFNPCPTTRPSLSSHPSCPPTLPTFTQMTRISPRSMKYIACLSYGFSPLSPPIPLEREREGVKGFRERVRDVESRRERESSPALVMYIFVSHANKYFLNLTEFWETERVRVRVRVRGETSPPLSSKSIILRGRPFGNETNES